MDYFTSDLHMFHDRKFIYEPRGFHSIKEMNETYINELLSLTSNDTLYILGDVCLGDDFDTIKEFMSKIPCDVHIIIGNHDTKTKRALYETLPNVVSVLFADEYEHNGRTYMLTHYCTETATLESNPKTAVINLHGHIHTTDKFHQDKPYLYNVSVDANENRIVSIDEIEKNIDAEIKKCFSYL